MKSDDGDLKGFYDAGNIYDATAEFWGPSTREGDVLLRSWLACMRTPRPVDWETIAFNLIADTENFLRGVSPASAAPVVDVCAWCKEAIKTAYVGLSGERYCSLGCQAQYESEVRRAGPDWERAAAAATAAPQQSETADYACDAIPNCGWRSTDTSRPIGNGIKVNCPQCSGAARFVGMTNSAPLEARTQNVQHVVNQWQAAWISIQDISRDSEADLVRRIEAMIATTAPVEQSDQSNSLPTEIAAIAEKVAVEIANNRLGPRSDSPQFWDKYTAYVKGIVMHHFASAPMKQSNKQEVISGLRAAVIRLDTPHVGEQGNLWTQAIEAVIRTIDRIATNEGAR